MLEFDNRNEYVTVRVREDIHFSFKGNELRINGLLRNAITTQFEMDLECSCTRDCCTDCGRFMSFESIEKNVIETEAAIVEKEKNRIAKVEKSAAKMEKATAERLILIEGKASQADIFLRGFEPPMRRYSGNQKFFNLTEALFLSLNRIASLDLDSKIIGEKKKFLMHLTSQFEAFSTILQHHYRRLVIDKDVSHFQNNFEIGLSFCDYLEKNCTRGNGTNFSGGDEFILKSICSFLRLEVNLLVCTPGADFTFLKFNPFVEFHNDNYKATLFLLYFGEDDYQLCEKIPSRTPVGNISPDERLFIESVSRDDSFLTIHDDISAGNDDLNISYSLVDRLSKNDEHIKDEINPVILDDFRTSQSNIVQMGDIVWSSDDFNSFQRAPVMNNIYRHVSNEKDPLKDLYSAISFAAEGKMYISYLLETATTALYFSNRSEVNNCRFRDQVDWLDYVECVKIGQMNRYLKKNGCMDQDGQKLLLLGEFRIVVNLIDTLKVPLIAANYGSDLLYREAEEHRLSSLEEATLRHKGLELSKSNKEAAWKKFKSRLNKIMFEICLELWQIWFNLSSMSEDERQKLVSIDDVHFENQNEASIVKYTVNEDMEDFQELITTYKSKFNTRKTADLPKNAMEAKKKHLEMKALYELKTDMSGESCLLFCFVLYYFTVFF